MYKKNWLGLLVGLMMINFAQGQLNDLARVDYTKLPAGNANTEFSRIRALFNYPIKLKKENAYLLLGLDYSNIDLYIQDNPSFDRAEINEFQVLDLNIGYTALLKKDWRLGVRLTPGLSSNLTAKDLNLRDIVLSADVVLIKDKKEDTTVSKPWRLIVGVSYSGNRGFNFPLPFISYYKKFRPKWSYNIGIPKTNLQYHASKTHRFKLYAELDGFTANLQNGLLIDDELLAKSINMSLILGGLQYEYHFTKNLEFYARASSILNNSLKLRDEKRKNIKRLDESNSLYLRIGLRLKI